MRIWKKILLASIAGLLFALIVFPILYRDKFSHYVQSEINKQINGSLQFGSAHISLIRNFPCVSLTLNDVRVTGNQSFQDVELLKARAFTLGFDLKRFLKSSFKEFQLTKLELDQANVNLLTTQEGIFNFTDLVQKTSSKDNQSAQFEILLDKLKISNSQFKYVDSSSKVMLTMKHIDHQSNGQYKSDLLELNQQTTFDSLIYSAGSMSFLKNVSGQFKGEIEWDSKSNRYTLKKDILTLNELNIQLDGWYWQHPDSTASMDLNFKTPDNNLKQLISLIPGAYQSHFKEMKASGKFNCAGNIKGNKNDLQHVVPLINLNAAIEDGTLKYDHLPYPIQNIQFRISIHSLDSFARNYKIELPTYSLEVEHESISGKLTVIQGTAGSAIQGDSKGSITLATLNKALPIDSMRMSGKLDFNTQFDFTQHQIEHKEYDKIKFSGHLKGEDIDIVYPDFLPFKAHQVNAELNPGQSTARFVNAHYGQSDLSGNLKITNPLALVIKNYRGCEIFFETQSLLLDLNEITHQNNKPASAPIDFSNESVIPLLHLNIKGKAELVKYRDYAIQHAYLEGKYKNDTLYIRQLNADLNQSKLLIDGNLNNPYRWTNEGQSLTGLLNITSDHFKLDPWISDSNSTTGKTDTIYVKNLPERTDLNIKAQLGLVTYGSYLFKSLKGDVKIVKQNLEIYNSSASLYNGKVSFNGLYQESESLPVYNFKLEMVNLKIEDMFKSSKTFSTLVPIASFLEGLFSSSFIFNGKLNSSFTPIWDELNAAGVLETFNGVFTKFKPLEEIVNKIQIPLLNKINWEKSKNYFEIEKGVMTIKPFEIKSGDITVQLGGQHHLDQEMNYDILFSIPRKVFDKYKVGMETNVKLDWMRAQAAKKGIKLIALDTIYLKANVQGTIKNPLTQLSWVENPKGKTIQEQLIDEVKDQIKAKVDSVKTATETKLNQKKDSILNILKEEVELKKEQIDSIKRKVTDSLKKIADQKSREILDSLIKKNAGKILDSSAASKLDTLVGAKAKEEIKKINDKLKDWNPFKKKPKSN